MPKTENPDELEWTEEVARKSVRFRDLPASLQRTLSPKHGKRGPQKSLTKTPTTIRLSPDVLAALRASGPGWQTRADEALRRWIITHTETLHR